MKNILAAFAACAVLAAAAPAFAQMHNDPHAMHGNMHADPHTRGMQNHEHYYQPPARAHDNHHYYQGEVYHGHPLVYRNNTWGYNNPGGIFVHINL